MIVAVPLGILVETMNEAGFFDNTKRSIVILWQGFNRFRMLEKEELETADRSEMPLEQQDERNTGQEL